MIEEKTACEATFTNIFSYQIILTFCKIPMLLSLILIRPILGHPLSVKITGFIPLSQKHQWGLMLKVVTESLSFIVIVHYFFFWIWAACFRTIPGFLALWINLFYFIILDSTCSFLSSDMEIFMIIVSDVNAVTIAMDSSFLGVRNLLLIIIIFFGCYCYYLLQSASPALLPIWG